MKTEEILRPKSTAEIMEGLSKLMPDERLKQCTAYGFLHGVKEALTKIRGFGDVSDAINIAVTNGRLDIIELIENKVIEIGKLTDKGKIYLKWKKQIAVNRTFK